MENFLYAINNYFLNGLNVKPPINGYDKGGRGIYFLINYTF